MATSYTRRTIWSLVRVVLSGILLTAAVAGCLYLHLTAFPFLRERLLETEMKTSAWLIKQLSFSLPFVLICLFFAVAYRGIDRRDGMASREKQWIVLLVALLSYAALLPYVNHLSKEMYESAVAAGIEIPTTDANIPWTLMLRCREWFVRLAIPLGILALFYGVRAAREKDCPDTLDTTEDTAPVAVEAVETTEKIDTAEEFEESATTDVSAEEVSYES